MPIFSGGGGAAFNGGTITRPLAVNPTDNTLEPLLSAQAPAGFDANTAGVLQQLVGESGQETLTAYDNSLRLVAGLGRGDYLVLLTSTDNASRAVAFGTGLGLAVTADTGAFELDSELGVRKFYASAAVGILTATHAAPADGDLSAGECALWFDQTNGAAKLMVKAKQADGTVRTGSLALV